MVKYILSLASDAQSRLPLAGTFTLKDHAGAGESGMYVISASYTDKGNKVTGPLTGREVVMLRNPKVQAEDFDSFRNVGRQQPHGDGTSAVSDIKDGSYISFKNIDLTGIKEIAFQVMSRENDGTIEVRAGAPNGKLVGTANINPGLDEQGWKTVTVPVITRPKGVNELFFVFRNKVVKDKSFMNLDWIYFETGAGKTMASR